MIYYTFGLIVFINPESKVLGAGAFINTQIGKIVALFDPNIGWQILSNI